jgi:hypothetical protein
MDKITLNDMIAQIREWHAEALSMHNDGWTQQHFKDRLSFLHARTTAVMESIAPSEYPQKEEKEDAGD